MHLTLKVYRFQRLNPSNCTFCFVAIIAIIAHIYLFIHLAAVQLDYICGVDITEAFDNVHLHVLF